MSRSIAVSSFADGCDKRVGARRRTCRRTTCSTLALLCSDQLFSLYRFQLQAVGSRTCRSRPSARVTGVDPSSIGLGLIQPNVGSCRGGCQTRRFPPALGAAHSPERLDKSCRSVHKSRGSRNRRGSPPRCLAISPRTSDRARCGNQRAYPLWTRKFDIVSVGQWGR